MKKYVALFTALLMASLLFSACSGQKTNAVTAGASASSFSETTGREDLESVDPSPLSSGESAGEGSGKETEFISILDEAEDPSHAETLLTIGSYNVPYGLFRYYYFALREDLLKSDPQALEGEKAAEHFENMKKDALQYCKVVAVYYTLAERFGITLPDDFEERFTAHVQQAEKSLQSYGMTFKDYFGEAMTRSVYHTFFTLDSFLADAVTAEIGKEERGLIDLSGEKAAAFFEEYRTVKHILVGYNDGLDDEAALALAETIIERCKNGEDFDALQKEYSNDYHEGASNVYTFTHGEMVEEFDDASFTLEENELSAPVKSTYGYHVILRLPLDSEAVKSEYIKTAAADVLSKEIENLEISNADRLNALTDAQIR